MRDKVTITQEIHDPDNEKAWIISEAEVWMSGGPHPSTVTEITRSNKRRAEFDKTNPIDLPPLEVSRDEFATIIDPVGVKYLNSDWDF